MPGNSHHRRFQPISALSAEIINPPVVNIDKGLLLEVGSEKGSQDYTASSYLDFCVIILWAFEPRHFQGGS